MTTYSPRSAIHVRLADQPPIDDLDAAIVELARQMNMNTYRLLMLVADFDDRFGWARWGFRNCAEWLSYRCDLTPSTAREKVRTAHALRLMPKIAAAFADGRLSYSKVRAQAARRGARRGGVARVCAASDGTAGRGSLPGDS